MDATYYYSHGAVSSRDHLTMAALVSQHSANKGRHAFKAKLVIILIMAMEITNALLEAPPLVESPRAALRDTNPEQRESALAKNGSFSSRAPDAHIFNKKYAHIFIKIVLHITYFDGLAA